jgi:hypothetical protein
MIAKVLFFSLALAVSAATASQLRETIDTELSFTRETIPQPPSIPQQPSIPEYPSIPEPSVLDEEVDIEAFMGEWYLTHASYLSTITDFKDVYCFSTTYTLVDDESGVEGDEEKVSFTFASTQRKGSFKGELETVGGVATNQISEYVKPLNGLFYFKFEGLKGSTGTLVIQALGPKVQSNPELYQWALVSDIARTDAFVLTRGRMDSESSDAALAKADSMGFDNFFWSKLKEVPQSESCNKPK